MELPEVEGAEAMLLPDKNCPWEVELWWENFEDWYENEEVFLDMPGVLN